MDENKDGKIGKEEFLKEMMAIKSREAAHKLRRRMLAVAVLIITLLAFSNLGTSFLAVWMNKDTKVVTVHDQGVYDQVQGNHGGAMLTAAGGSSGGQVIQTATASVSLPLSAVPAMTLERLGTVSSLTVGLFLHRKSPMVDEYVQAPPFMPSGTTGFMKKVSQVVGVTKLSSTAVIFSLAEPGHSVIIADGFANLTVRDINGAVLWNEAVCPDSAGCSAITADADTEADALVGAAQEARAASRLRRLGSEEETCWDPDATGPEAHDCECMHLLNDNCLGNPSPDDVEQCFITTICAWDFVCNEWKERHGCARRLAELPQLDLPKLEDAFEGVDTFVKERTHGRRLGKCAE